MRRRGSDLSWLGESPNSWSAVQQATGVLIERLGISLDEAFGLLRGYARNHSLRIAVVASDVVTGRRTLGR